MASNWILFIVAHFPQSFLIENMLLTFHYDRDIFHQGTLLKKFGGEEGGGAGGREDSGLFLKKKLSC